MERIDSCNCEVEDKEEEKLHWSRSAPAETPSPPMAVGRVAISNAEWGSLCNEGRIIPASALDSRSSNLSTTPTSRCGEQQRREKAMRHEDRQLRRRRSLYCSSGSSSSLHTISPTFSTRARRWA
jgi:hypothetical protein